MNTNPYKLGLLASAIAFASSSAIAVDIRIDGFASIIYGQALDKDELGSDGVFMGYNDQADFQADSMYGIQFRSNLADKLSATGQLVGRGDQDYSAEITWAYLTYQFNNDWAIKAGRQRIPYFLYSDFLDVAYAYTWISPPDAIYDLGGFENIDGVNVEFTKLIGNWTSRVNMVYGSSDTDVSDGTGGIISISTNDFWDITWNLNYDWFTLQMNYSSTSVIVSAYNDLADGIAQFYPFLTDEQYDLLSVDEDKSAYVGIGISADLGSWFAVTEYVDSELKDSPIGSSRSGWYVMGGFRLDKWTFALTYSEFDNPNTSETIAILDQVVPILNIIPGFIADPGQRALAEAGLDQLIPGIENAYYRGQESSTYNFTVRYDFHPSAAFKFDYTESDLDLFTSSGVQNLKPSVVRMGVDLVF